ncbi:unnamed protein product [Pylaiella littoralis]
MEGLGAVSSGVTLENGTSQNVGSSITLVSGRREWRLRVPSVKESSENMFVLEVKQGTTWYPAQEFVIVDDVD